MLNVGGNEIGGGGGGMSTYFDVYADRDAL